MTLVFCGYSSWTVSRNPLHSVRCVTCSGLTLWRITGARKPQNISVTTQSGVALIFTGMASSAIAQIISVHVIFIIQWSAFRIVTCGLVLVSCNELCLYWELLKSPPNNCLEEITSPYKPAFGASTENNKDAVLFTPLIWSVNIHQDTNRRN